MKTAQLTALWPSLLGRTVVLTARQPHRSGIPLRPDQIHIGRLIAIGHRTDRNQTVCVVLDATALGNGVPIIAQHAVTGLRAATAAELRDAAARRAAERATESAALETAS